MNKSIICRRVLTTLCSLVWLVAAGPANADWPSWRGAAGGVATDHRWPDDFDPQRPIWTFDTKATDEGSVAIRDDSAFVLTSAQGEISLCCLDVKSGQPRWRKTWNQKPPKLHSRNSPASTTPVVDGKGVVIAFAETEHTTMIAVDHDGNEVWNRDFGPWLSQHGFGSSPVIDGDRVYLHVSRQADRLPEGVPPSTSFMVAVDRTTGEDLWQCPLTPTRTCYAAPAPISVGGRTFVVAINTGDGVVLIDRESGKIEHRLPVIESRVCGSPIVADQRIYATFGGGSKGNLICVDANPDGLALQFTTRKSAPYVPTPVLHQDRLYVIADTGIASCLDAETGAPLWSGRVGGKFGASPVLIGDRLFVVSLDGQASLLSTDAFKVISSFDFGGPVQATPAMADGRMFVRVGAEVRCYDLPRP